MEKVIKVWVFVWADVYWGNGIVGGGGLDGYFGEQGLPAGIQECLERFHRRCVDSIAVGGTWMRGRVALGGLDRRKWTPWGIPRDHERDLWRTTKKPKTTLPRKRRLRNDLVLTHKIFQNQIHLEATQLIKFLRRPGLSRSSIRLLHQTGRTRPRWNNFACRVVNKWNRLPLSVVPITEQRNFKKLLDSNVYS